MEEANTNGISSRYLTGGCTVVLCKHEVSLVVKRCMSAIHASEFIACLRISAAALYDSTLVAKCSFISASEPSSCFKFIYLLVLSIISSVSIIFSILPPDTFNWASIAASI